MAPSAYAAEGRPRRERYRLCCRVVRPRQRSLVTGKEIANYAKAVWAAYPDASVELITVADTGGGLVAAQWVLRGTTPTGRTVTIPGASFTQVEGDKIRSEQTYFDRQNLLEQLNLNQATSNSQ